MITHGALDISNESTYLPYLNVMIWAVYRHTGDLFLNWTRFSMIIWRSPLFLVGSVFSSYADIHCDILLWFSEMVVSSQHVYVQNVLPDFDAAPIRIPKVLHPKMPAGSHFNNGPPSPMRHSGLLSAEIGMCIELRNMYLYIALLRIGACAQRRCESLAARTGHREINTVSQRRIIKTGLEKHWL